MKNIFLSFVMLFSSSVIMAQNPIKKHYIKDFPTGYYLTLEDFLVQKTSPPDSLVKVDVLTRKIIPDSIKADHLFFFVMPKEIKLKKVFAVSYGGDLYIREEYFYKYASKGDRVDNSNTFNSYHRVMADGNFFYLEGIFANGWKQGIGYGLGGAVGGMMSQSMNDLKPIIFNFQTQRFDLFRNCEDFNAFLSSISSTDIQPCEKRYIPFNRMKEILLREIDK